MMKRVITCSKGGGRWESNMDWEWEKGPRLREKGGQREAIMTLKGRQKFVEVNSTQEGDGEPSLEGEDEE